MLSLDKCYSEKELKIFIEENIKIEIKKQLNLLVRKNSTEWHSNYVMKGEILFALSQGGMGIVERTLQIMSN